MASQYEITRAEQIVDVRPWGTRTAEWLSDPEVLTITTLITLAITFAAPVLMLFTAPFLLAVFVASRGAATYLPLRYPPNKTNPETGKTGDGIWFLGNMEFSKKKENRLPLETAVDKFKEVWFADDDMRKHLLVLGSTGSGKSELLKGIFFCALCWGSGFFVADGKADNKLPLDTYNMAAFFGRDDDLLTLNFLLAGKTPQQVRNSRQRRTNKTNPVSTADAATIEQMGANLLPKVDGDAKNWQEKALNCWRGLVPALCWLRDNEDMEISVSTFVDYVALVKIEELYAKGYQLAQRNGGEWLEEFTGLKSYLEVGLPGFKVDRCLRKHNLLPSQTRTVMGGGGKPEPTDQDATCYDQHGYRATQLSPALNLLDKTYGHIFRDKFSEIDMVDVTLNNRILVLLIPSLEKSAQEAESLGKLTVACLRVMMGKNLGADTEGTRQEILESKATEARYPYIVALDELGYYFADGIAVMFAQARSLGFCMIAAAQDIEKLTEGNRAAEAGAMLANQVAKIFMRIDDANKTNEMIQKYLGKVNVAIRETYEHREGFGQKKTMDVKVAEIPVATLQNLQGLDPGKAILNTMGKTFKVSTFYVGSFLGKYPTEIFHINRFLQVRGLTRREIEEGIQTADGTEFISTAIDMLNDKQIKGYRMQQILVGDEEMPDVRAVADAAPYALKHDKAVDMVNAVAAVALTLPANVVGAQRAIALYQTARKFVLESRAQSQTKGGGRTGGDAHVDKTHASLNPAEVYVTPAQAAAKDAAAFAKELVDTSGSSIATGSGTGQGPDSLASPHDRDPLDFLNESKPLERKPAAEVLSVSPKVPNGLTGVLSGVGQVLRDGSPGTAEPVVESGAESHFNADVPLSNRLAMAVQGLIDVGESLDFSGLVSVDDTNKYTPPDVEKASADAQWIGRALAGAAVGLAAKGDTVVGFTEKTKASFQRVEAALGNDNPEQAARAIEQLVAQQTTPQPLDASASGADFDDINALMMDVEASLSK